jgi:DNA-binding XRE family transcriptional regulator
MPNIAIAIREEIVRLTRRELKKETAGIKKASTQHRKDIAALKRQVIKLQRINGLLERNVLAKPIKPPKGMDASRVRFSPKGLQTQRERLGLSAADYAKLAGVSGLSVYNWEKGKARPRKEQVATLAALRGLSKREAAARLEQLNKGK